jgi:hypothetical protein
MDVNVRLNENNVAEQHNEVDVTLGIINAATHNIICM